MLRVNKKFNSSSLNLFLKPKEVFIPLIIDNSDSVTLLVKENDYVYKGQIIGRKKDESKLGIFSSVSGRVIDFVFKTYFDGRIIKCVHIENDFKECYESKRKERKDLVLNNNEFVDLLKTNGIVNLSSGEAIYKMYEKRCKTLVVNAFEGDPYFSSVAALLKVHTDEILEAIDAIIKINGMDDAIIVLNNLDNISVKCVNNYVGTYDRISLVCLDSDIISGNNECLINKLNLDKDKVIVNDIFTIYAIYEALRYDVPLLQRIITVGGDGVKKAQNVLVKNGTSALELIEFVGGYKRFNYSKMCLVAGSSFTGKSMENDDFVIGLNLSGILAIKMIDDLEESPCIKCGKCIEVCPKKLNPLLIMNSNSEKVLKKLRVDDCTGCGMCSYVCPSNILVREKVKEANK